MSEPNTPLTPEESAALVAHVRARLNTWVPGEGDQGVIDMAAMVLQCGIPERERALLLREIEAHFLAHFDEADGLGTGAVRPILIDWLDTATRGLCDDAKARIRAEVSDHFEAAMSAAVANGDTRLDAALRAREELGCPSAARRRFHESNLTLWEEGQIAQIEGPAPRRGKLYSTLAVIGASSMVFMLFWQFPFNALALAGLASNAVAMIGQPLHRYFRFPLRASLALGIGFKAVLTVFTLYLCRDAAARTVMRFFYSWAEREYMGGFLLVIAMGLAISLCTLPLYVRLLRKLPSTQHGVRS